MFLRRTCLGICLLICCLLPAVSAFALELTAANHTTKKISLAVSYMHSDSKTWVCRGWWTIEPLGKLSIKLDTNNRLIYFLGVSGKTRWGGKADAEGTVSLPVTSQKFLYKVKTERPTGEGFRVENFKAKKLGGDGRFTIIFND